MAEGQSIDLSIVSQNVELDLLNDMHKKKTGALLGCAINFGALLNDTSDKDLSMVLESFSSNIGLSISSSRRCSGCDNF